MQFGVIDKEKQFLKQDSYRLKTGCFPRLQFLLRSCNPTDPLHALGTPRGMGRGGLHLASFLGPDVLGSLLRADKVKRERLKQAIKTETLDRALIPKMMQNK